jgi:Transposase IS116/IS110/IS902 family
MILVRQIETISTEIAALDTALRKENKASELGPRLETIPSIGPVIASALRARVTDAKLFENGRHLSAWIGIVPENDSTGGKVKAEGALQEGRPLSALTSRHRRDGRRAPGAEMPGQASLGREARPHVGQAGGDRDRQ